MSEDRVQIALQAGMEAIEELLDEIVPHIWKVSVEEFPNITAFWSTVREFGYIIDDDGNISKRKLSSSEF